MNSQKVKPQATPILPKPGTRPKRGESVWQGLDRSTSAPLPPQAGFRQTRRLQNLDLRQTTGTI